MKKVLFILFLCFVIGCRNDDGGDGGSSNACSALNLRISNGDNCSISNTPVILIIGKNAEGIFTCSGTLVSLTSVLTAAHCLPPGLLNLAVVTEHQTFNIGNGGITDLAVHPQYTTFSDGSTVYDFAMIRLASAADGAPVPIGISRELVAGDQIEAYGFGQDEDDRSVFDRSPSDLLKAGFMIISNPGDLVFEARYDLTNQSVCQGDSGGPAIASVGGQSSIVGVTSYGSAAGCLDGSFADFGSVREPAVYNFIKGFAPDAITR